MLRTSPSRHCDVCSSAIGLGVVFLSPTVFTTLCVVHRDVTYLRRARGETFISQMTAAWTARGEMTLRRLRALDNHRRRVRAPVARRLKPGSYAWPLLRLHAEWLFAAGVRLNDAFDHLETLYRESFARFPSFSTMRRWFSDARWLSEPKRWKARYALQGIVGGRTGQIRFGERTFKDVLLQRFSHPALRSPPWEL